MGRSILESRTLRFLRGISLLAILLFLGITGCTNQWVPPPDESEPVDPCANKKGQVYEREYGWHYGEWEFWLPRSLPAYEVCQAQHANVPRNGNFPWSGMKELVNWSNDDSVLQDFANAVTHIPERMPYAYGEYYAKVNKALFFVQEMMPYTYDIGDYWQLPLETLVKKGGDCEDGTILYVSLLMTLDYPIRFGAYWNPVNSKGHSFAFVQVTAGWKEWFKRQTVACKNLGWTVGQTDDGKWWAMAETTVDPERPGDGYLGCGDIPQAAWDADKVRIINPYTSVDVTSMFESF